MSRPKYSLEIEINEEASGYEDRLPWVSYGTIVAFGDTLDECLESASVDLIDQDGGERGQVEADADWMQALIVDKFYEKEGTRMPGQTVADFRAWMDTLQREHDLSYTDGTSEESDAARGEDE